VIVNIGLGYMSNHEPRLHRGGSIVAGPKDWRVCKKCGSEYLPGESSDLEECGLCDGGKTGPGLKELAE